jgi:hypothetical protein
MRFLSNYLDFIFEAVAKQEMRLYYSDEFRNILRRIQDKSSVAQALLNSEDSNQMIDIYTLIDITEKNDTISLIQVNRITRINTDLGETLPYNIRDKRRGSEFWTKARTEMKIGRWTSRIFTEVHKSELPASKIEEFVNLYKAAIDGEDLTNFELVSGEDIRKWYHENNYKERRGQLGNSCMRYNNCQDFLDIYVKNPEVCQLLILKSDDDKDKITGRALIWKLKDGEYYMDRIYTIKTADEQLFKEWAIKNKYWFKSNQDFSEFTSFEFHKEDGTVEKRQGEFSVKLDSKGDYHSYPYMDSFKYYSVSKGALYNSSNFGYDYELVDTEGGNGSCSECGGNGRVECSRCDGDGTDECDECNGRGKVECDDCSGAGEVECHICDGEGTDKCSSCGGSGKDECEDCDGSGKEECEDCGGSGEIDGDECDSCLGNGKHECSSCGGEGGKECSDCDGEGRSECNRCKGDGTIKCNNCDGDGDLECDDCDGSGERECPRCDGEGREDCSDC